MPQDPLEWARKGKALEDARNAAREKAAKAAAPASGLKVAAATSPAATPPATTPAATPPTTTSAATAASVSEASKALSHDGFPARTVHYKGSTDVIYQQFRLFVEGVEVPFLNIEVTQGANGLPSAYISIPAWAGLLDIARGYRPKVHIFYRDWFTNEDCLMFQGFIAAVQYQKTKNGTGSVTIGFSCKHKYDLISEITVNYSGMADGTLDPETKGGQMQGAATVAAGFSAEESILEALEGITQVGDGSNEVNRFNIQKEGSSATVFADKLKTSTLPLRWSTHKNRLVGFPGTFVNLWQQMLRPTELEPERYEIMSDLYKPLMEEGLDFFRRLVGHYYIEGRLDETREDSCGSEGSNGRKVLTPPCSKLFNKSAIQTDFALNAIMEAGQFQTLNTSLIGMYTSIAQAIKYDLLVLSSPAMAPVDPSKAHAESGKVYPADVILKPQMPMYYSPACNVVYPNMIVSMSFSQSEDAFPSRMSAVGMVNGFDAGNTMLLQFRAPNSIRESYAEAAFSIEVNSRLKAQEDKAKENAEKFKDDPAGLDKANAEIPNDPNMSIVGMDLSYVPITHTTNMTTHRVGLYEQGNGVRISSIALPYWMQMLTESSKGETSEANPPTAEPLGEDYELLKKAWESRYYWKPSGVGKDGKMSMVFANKAAMNPFAPESMLNNTYRILFSMADYEFSQAYASTRGGQVSTVFNPYIVPGYPMDIISAVPADPSFHATCSSVSHSISPNGISTNVTFVSAVSYTELGNYHMPFVFPWLQVALGLIKKYKDPTGGKYSTDSSQVIYSSTIVNNSRGRAIADKFYNQVLGCPAAAPEHIYDFKTGIARSRTGKVKVSNIDGTGRQLTGLLSVYGSLFECYRRIESLGNIEALYGYDFIDMHPSLYTKVAATYTPSLINDPTLLEPGASMFLDYFPKMFYNSYFNESMSRPGRASAFQGIFSTKVLHGEADGVTSPGGRVEEIKG